MRKYEMRKYVWKNTYMWKETECDLEWSIQETMNSLILGELFWIQATQNISKTSSLEDQMEFIAYLSKRSTSTVIVTERGKGKVRIFVEILKSSLSLVFKCEGCSNHIIRISAQQ